MFSACWQFLSRCRCQLPVWAAGGKVGLGPLLALLRQNTVLRPPFLAVLPKGEHLLFGLRIFLLHLPFAPRFTLIPVLGIVYLFRSHVIVCFCTKFRRKMLVWCLRGSWERGHPRGMLRKRITRALCLVVPAAGYRNLWVCSVGK